MYIMGICSIWYCILDSVTLDGKNIIADDGNDVVVAVVVVNFVVAFIVDVVVGFKPMCSLVLSLS